VNPDEEKRDVRWSQTLLKKEQILLSFNKVRSCIGPIIIVEALHVLCTRYKCCIRASSVVYALQVLYTRYKCCIRAISVVYALHVLCTRYKCCIDATSTARRGEV